MVEAGLYAVARLEATAFHGVVAPGGAGPGAALVAAGTLSAAVGAALCFAQRHLKRLLAFSTVAHAGILLAAVGLATPDGIAAAMVYALGHGLVKGALFLGAGLVLHRLRSVDEIGLRGRGRGLVLPGVVLGAGGLGLAGLPPFATFRGEALLHRALADAGWGGLAPVFAAASAVTAAAVLRATFRVFLGLGPRQAEAPGPRGEVSERAETQPSREAAPLTMAAPAVALLALALLAGLWPGLSAGAQAAAARFLDGPAYAARVLHGASPARARAPADEPLAAPAFRAAVVAGAAVALALVVLRRKRLPAGVRAAVARAWNPAIRALRALHGGRIGDSVVWLAVGAALLAGVCLLAG